MLIRIIAACLTLPLLAALGAAAQEARPPGADERPYRYTIWDLELGAHARELPRGVYADFACGTRGGPPSIPLRSWLDYARCPAEPDTGLHEVHFRYDDEIEYIARAADPRGENIFRPEGTAEFQLPIIVSGLFDANGFLVGTRLVTDPRTDVETRSRGETLAGVFRSRFGFGGWSCEDLPKGEGETPFRGSHIKDRCFKDLPEEGLRLMLERHFYRKAGQTTIDPVTRLATEGYFVSETRFERLLSNPIADPEAHLAGIEEPPPTEVELLAERVRDCPGCDLRGVNLKRADLRDANLAGADLSHASLHAADLRGADLTGAVLIGANLNRADLRGATLSSADLFEALLYAARLEGADLAGTDMRNALAARVQMTRANAAGLLAAAADLRFSRMLNADLRGADFSNAILHEAQFARSDLTGSKLVGAELWNASLTETNLAGADARDADLTGADLRGADLSAADFSSARMVQANLADVNRDGTRFDGARLPAGFR